MQEQTFVAQPQENYYGTWKWHIELGKGESGVEIITIDATSFGGFEIESWTSVQNSDVASTSYPYGYLLKLRKYNKISDSYEFDTQTVYLNKEGHLILMGKNIFTKEK